MAFVVSVLENGQPVADGTKLGRLRQILLDIMDVEGDSVAHIKRVRCAAVGGTLGTDRRGKKGFLRVLHQNHHNRLMMCCPSHLLLMAYL